MMNHLSPNFLQKLLSYDAQTGVLTWKERDPFLHPAPGYVDQWNGRWAGKVAGGKRMASCGKPYWVVRVFSRAFYAHQIVMALHGNDFQGKEIDHIDGNGLNNRIENLRFVSRLDNAKNHRRQKSNSSGVTGVGFHSRDLVWTARGHANGKVIHLGSFKKKSLAVAARKSWEIQAGFHKNHGRDRPL